MAVFYSNCKIPDGQIVLLSGGVGLSDERGDQIGFRTIFRVGENLVVRCVTRAYRRHFLVRESALLLFSI